MSHDSLRSQPCGPLQYLGYLGFGSLGCFGCLGFSGDEVQSFRYRNEHMPWVFGGEAGLLYTPCPAPDVVPEYHICLSQVEMRGQSAGKHGVLPTAG